MSDAGRASTYAPGVMWPAAMDARSPLVEILSVLSSSFDLFLLAFASRLQVFRGFREGLLKILRGNNPLHFELQHYRQTNRDSNSSSDQRFEEDWIGNWLIKSFTQNIVQVFFKFLHFLSHLRTIPSTMARKRRKGVFTNTIDHSGVPFIQGLNRRT